MVCKNCGNRLKNNEKFCTICGTYNDLDSASLESDELGNVNENYEEFGEFQLKKKAKKSTKKEVVEYAPGEDPLMAAYIGEDYKWVAERPFNIYALLLSWMYFLYRKLYLIGIIGLIVTGVILKFAPIIIAPYIVLSMVFSGLFFNKIYLDAVEKRVNKIQNNAKGLDDLEKICKKKGGVNVFLPLLIFFLFLVGMLLSYINIDYQQKEPNFWNENSSNKANCKSMGKQVYSTLSSYNIEGDIEEFACVIEKGSYKTYNLYFKLINKATYQYLYFKNDSEGYFIIQGNTDLIDELEALQEEYGLAESDEDFLLTSKELSNQYSSIKDDSEYEDRLIREKSDTREKLHFVFTKDDILN